MNAKLTLKLDEAVIQSAKKYAKDNRTSLSQLTESYFRGFISEEELDAEPVSGVISELVGILRDANIDDIEKDRLQYLEEKHK